MTDLRGIYENPTGVELDVQFAAATAREFRILGEVYVARRLDVADDWLVTAEGLASEGFVRQERESVGTSDG